MGLFDFFRSKKEECEEGRKTIPTITPAKEIFDCYAEVFKIDMGNVSGISSSEVSEIYKIISQSDGGFLNMGAYHSSVYEKYFKGREWAWNEYDRWNEKFTKLGKFPKSFHIKFVITTEAALGLLSVAELKDLLKLKNITHGSKVKKQDLIDLAKYIPDVLSYESINSKVAEELEKERYFVYSILMRTINFRGKSLYDYNRDKNIGIKKFEIIQTFDEDKVFADMALKENPKALPPLYPCDLSILKPIIDF